MPAWEHLPEDLYRKFWDAFDRKFDFRAGYAEPDAAIIEPSPSVTFDLHPLFADPGATFAAGQAAINAITLFSMTQAFSAEERLLVLDWQHSCHWFWPHRHAVADDETWPVEVFPDGDYHTFLTEDMTEGTFGHPWEQTLCVFGPRLMPKLGPILMSWLPIKRSRPR
ncbi:DUF2716 domain-containing protein [Actinoplanes oblitus]|uniref:DUF2716 domain-containing protein n=1 Tax=Actinoplanes oblitus TaxID=3040509 RepID=A0ABY8WTX3_9ACTN|nr:DUF2716 domain-containing protein [Actinoplanes oblitus]WIN00923.1 DUF2716 domain-containing protein [Actinoplanes oblitus]